MVTVRELIHEIYDGLAGTSPLSGAVPSNLPLLRTLQLAADATRGSFTEHRLLQLAGGAQPAVAHKDEGHFKIVELIEEIEDRIARPHEDLAG